MAELNITGLSVRAGAAKLVTGANLRLRPGELVGLLGPNGAGKTSLVRAAVGVIRPNEGQATLDGVPTWQIDAAARARKLAYLPQARPLAWPSTVRDIVALGRFSHGASPGCLGEVDQDAVDRALQACDLADLADRRSDTLSGGELARMHCARAFAAEAPLLVADEPTAALDPGQQFRVLDLIAHHVAAGSGALVVIHDVTLAARYCSRLVWMKEGRITADGHPRDTLSEERLAAVYGIRAHVHGVQVDFIGPA